jgi:dihydropyrimidinase
MYDLLIRGGTVVSPTRIDLLDIAVIHEQIVALGSPGSLGANAKKVIEADGLLVIPGGVDPHCHYNMPIGRVRGESQAYSPAAAYGGTTTVIDFALQEPPISLHDAIEAKKAEAKGPMAVDYGLHAIVSGEVSFEVMDEIGDVIRAGVPTIKTLMTYTWNVDDGHRFGVMSQVAEHGGMSVIHAEDDSIAKWLTKKLIREGKTHGAYISEARGQLVEEAAIRRAMLIAERAGSALYVLHMAARTGVQALAEGRRRGLPFYGETLITYLSATADDLWRGEGNSGLLWANFPAIKEREDQAVLWEAVADGRLQVVSSDHMAYIKSDKFEKRGITVDTIGGGQAAVELRVPVLFSEGVQKRRITLSRFVELIAANPARIMGLYPRKGAIEVGSDADIVLLDPKKRWTVRHEDLHMVSDYSCWNGWELEGKVRTTILRGSVLVENEQFVGSKNGGQFIPRKLLPEVTSFSRAKTSVEAN